MSEEEYYIGEKMSSTAPSEAGRMTNKEINDFIQKQSDDIKKAFRGISTKKAPSRKELGEFLMTFAKGRAIMRVTGGGSHAAAKTKLTTEQAKAANQKKVSPKTVKAEAAGPSTPVRKPRVARNQDIHMSREQKEEIDELLKAMGEQIPSIGVKRKQHWPTGVRVTNKNPYYNYPVGRRRRRIDHAAARSIPAPRAGSRSNGSESNSQKHSDSESNGGSESNSEKRRNKRIAEKGWLKNLGNKNPVNVLREFEQKLQKAKTDAAKTVYKEKIEKLKDMIKKEQQVLKNTLLARSRGERNPLHQTRERRMRNLIEGPLPHARRPPTSLIRYQPVNTSKTGKFANTGYQKKEQTRRQMNKLANQMSRQWTMKNKSPPKKKARTSTAPPDFAHVSEQKMKLTVPTKERSQVEYKPVPRFPFKKQGSQKYSLAKQPTIYGPPVNLNDNLRREAVRREQLYGNTGPARSRLNIQHLNRIDKAWRNLNQAKKQLEQSEKDAKEKAKRTTTQSIRRWMKQSAVKNPSMIRQAIKHSVKAQKIEDIQEWIKKHPSNANRAQKNLAHAMKNLEESLVNQTVKQRITSIQKWLRKHQAMQVHARKAIFRRAMKKMRPYVVPPRAAPASPPKKKNRLSNLQEEANKRKEKRLKELEENRVRRQKEIREGKKPKKPSKKAPVNRPGPSTHNAYGNPIMTREQQKEVKKLIKRGKYANNNKLKDVVSDSNTNSNSMKNFVVETNSNANSNAVGNKKKKRNGRFFESNSNGGSA